MGCIFKCVISHGRLWAFCSSFVLFFCLAVVAYFVLLAPFLAFGVVQLDSAWAGAIGCGIGTALVSAAGFVMNE